MSSKKFTNKQYILSAIGAVVVLVVIVFIFKLYPVAIVSGSFVSTKDWQTDLKIARSFDPAATRSTVFEQFIKSKAKEQLALKWRLSAKEAVAAEKLFLQSGKSSDYIDLINKNFEGSEKLFVDYVVAPEAIDSLLRIKYNQDFSANNDAYNKATNVLAKLDQGKSFEDLAKTYSEDKVSAQLGGDLGFLGEHELLPELEKDVSNATLGEAKKQIVVSRLGYHIIYPVEVSQKNGQKVWHLKHILIQTKGYDSWLSEQLQKVSVWRIISV